MVPVEAIGQRQRDGVIRNGSARSRRRFRPTVELEAAFALFLRRYAQVAAGRRDRRPDVGFEFERAVEQGFRGGAVATHQVIGTDLGHAFAVVRFLTQGAFEQRLGLFPVTGLAVDPGDAE